MIVSHRHRFVFFAVPRTGTHAIRAALAPSLGGEDWQQQSLTEQVRLPIPALARIGHGHITVREAQAWLPSEIWRSYFKFAVVRDPYQRYVSVCAFLNKRNPAFIGNERAFMKAALQRPRFRQRVLVRPQSAMLLDARGRVGVDVVGRYETLQESFDTVCRQVGIAPRRLALRNVSSHGDAAAYFDDELVVPVTDFYRRDFDAFGYPVAADAAMLRCA